MKHDAPYYEFHDGVTCLQDLIETQGMGWNQGNALKGIIRWGRKDGASKEYDLLKAKYFIDRELCLMQGNPRTSANATDRTTNTEGNGLEMREMPEEKT